MEKDQQLKVTLPSAVKVAEHHDEHEDLVTPLLAELFPASASVADAALIGSSEGVLELSAVDDPAGVRLTSWLHTVSAGLDEALADVGEQSPKDRSSETLK